MDHNATALIVGASMAGGRAAEALRSNGFKGRIVLVGAEAERPYERPPLSKGFLTGKVAAEDSYLRPTAFYAEHNIELRLGTHAIALDASQQAVSLDDGATLPYDTLLIATGAQPRRLGIPGEHLDGVHYLRTIQDAERISTALAAARHVVVIGMGFIGAEIAAACRELDCEVTALEAGALPMQAALGTEVAGRLAGVHRARGVDLRTGQCVTELLGNETVTAVSSNGEQIPCDAVVIGIGVEPATDWLAGSGVEVDGGVVTDEQCRTNVSRIFAAGDVARQYHPRYERHLRIEHFDHAANQGDAAAKSMLGLPVPEIPLPFFWSDQYDLNIQVAGLTLGHDEVVFRGDAESGSWSAFYLRQGAFIAALAVNRFRDLSSARRILAQRLPVTATALADESIELRSLLTRGGA